MSAHQPAAEAFVVQCETDYVRTEITAVAHVATGANSPTHLLAVAELHHKYIESNPLIGLGPPKGYPRRISLGKRGGSLLVHRWTLTVREGIEWYRACLGGSMQVPGTRGPTLVQLGQLGEDPPWPHLVAEVEKFWPHSQFWGDRCGGSRWHRMLPLRPVEVASGWGASDYEKARQFLKAEIHVDLLSRSVLLGSCHLRLPNPVYRRLHQRVGDDWRSIIFEVDPHPNQPVGALELTLWNRRGWGATAVRQVPLQAGANLVAMPEGVEQVAHAVCSEGRGLLEQSEVAGFIASINMKMNYVTERRQVEEPQSAQGHSTGYTVDIIGHTEEIEAGTPRPVQALSRLADDEDQQSARKAWAQVSFRWFDGDSRGGAQAIRDIIGSATRRVDLLDPYFGRSDLRRFALATTRHGLPLRVLTSADYCSGGVDPELKMERGVSLAQTLDSVRASDPRLNIEIKVMAGSKSPVHDRFLLVDDTVWVLGASLNEFGSRGSLLMRLPAPPVRDESGIAAFSISKDIFDAHWNRPEASSTPIHDWVRQRAARTSPPLSIRPVTAAERLSALKNEIRNCVARVLEVWRA